VCIDETRQAWCLLGENHRSELCHFHGWVERGETFEMGAAREAYEESRGLLGDALTLWRAVCDPSFSRRFNSIVVLSLGELTAASRQSMCADFASRPIVFRGMTEVARVHWLPMLPLSRLCLRNGSAGAGFEGDVQAPLGTDLSASNADAVSSVLPSGVRIRSFLLQRGWLGRGGLWEHPDVCQLLHTGIFPEGWLRLQDIPVISAGETACLHNSLCDTAAAAVSDQPRRNSAAVSTSADDRRLRRKCES
jgi:hypothetical protein